SKLSLGGLAETPEPSRKHVRCCARNDKFQTVGLTRRCLGQRAARTLAMSKFLDPGFEVRNRKVRPGLAYENKFRERTLPKQKVGQALLATRANEQIHFRGAAAIHFGKDSAEGLGRKLGDFVEAARGVKDRLTRGIIDREAEIQARAAGRRGFGVGDG